MSPSLTGAAYILIILSGVVCIVSGIIISNKKRACSRTLGLIFLLSGISVFLSETISAMTRMSGSRFQGIIVILNLAGMILSVTIPLLFLIFAGGRYGPVHSGYFASVIILSAAGYLISVYVRISLEMYMKHMDAWYYDLAVRMGFGGNRYHLFVSLASGIVSAAFQITIWIILTRLFYVKRDQENVYRYMWMFILAHVFLLISGLFVTAVIPAFLELPDIAIFIIRITVSYAVPGFALTFIRDLSVEGSRQAL